MSSVRREPSSKIPQYSNTAELAAALRADPLALLHAIVTHQAPRPRTEPSRFLSVAETAARLGVDSMTLYRAIRENQFPAVKIRGRYLIPAKAIDEMADAAVASGAVVDVAAWAAEGSAS